MQVHIWAMRCDNGERTRRYRSTSGRCGAMTGWFGLSACVLISGGNGASSASASV
jgi:hypothetical protein